MRLEAVDEQAAFMIRRRVHRAAHGVAAATSEPCFGGGKQRIRGGLIAHSLEEPEEANTIAVKLVMGAILDRSDTPYGFAIPKCQEKLPVCRAVERIGLGIKGVAHGNSERRHPLRVLRSVIDLPWQIYETP